MNIDRRSLTGMLALLGGSALAGGTNGAELGSEGVEPELPIKLGYKPVLDPRHRLDARSVVPPVLTQMLAAHTVRVKYSDLDPGVVTRTKHRVLDLIGCAIGGAPGHGNAALVDLARSMGGTPEASVIGYPLKGPASQIAMVNGAISRSFDFEVMSVFLPGKECSSHHSPTTCMTALALCERAGLSGQDFITALTVGDDIAARMLTACGGVDFGDGWDGAPIYSSIAATAIAAKLIGASPQQTQDAFGLVVDTIAGTVQNIWDGATDWKLPQGYAARNAIVAAELAKRGWVGIDDALAAPYGFYAQYTNGLALPHYLTDDLGRAFYGEEYFKPYPACAATHPHIECAVALQQKARLQPADIDQVTVRVPERSLSVFVSKPFEARRSPHCDANFSIQFQVANVLVNGRATRPEDYAEAAIRSPRMTSMTRRTALATLPPGERGVWIEVRTRDGRTLTEQRAGQPDRWPSVRHSTYAEIEAKFRQQVAFSQFVDRATEEQIISRVARLEQERNMADFMRLVTRTHLPTPV